MFWKTETPDNDDNSNAENEGHNNGTNNEESTQQQHNIFMSMSPSSSSPSKQAVHIMNITSGLCAHPLHFHSFTTVGSGWVIPSPTSLFVGAFQKCVACHGRLGGSAHVAHTNQEDGSSTSVASSPEMHSFSGMLRCVACGVYAHRSCAFAARPTVSSSSSKTVGNIPPPCVVNLTEIGKAFGMSREQIIKWMDVSQPTAVTESSSWSIFGKRSLVASYNTVETNGSKKSLKSDIDEKEVIPNNPVNRDSDAEATNKSNEEEFGDSMLEEKKEPSVDESETTPIQRPGVIETSIKLIQKTTETTKNIPKASAIGMVAGGAAGLAIAGPAGIIAGCQIGRTVLAVGAAVEGGLGMSVLVMSLAAAANFSLSSSASEEERELKLNSSSTLVLVRPDIAVDPIWGEYTNEARRTWAEKNKESLPSSCGSFGLGSLFLSTHSMKEDMRYRKDSDIIKADASELPMREKVFLLVNRILNDKMSLPGYLYRYLILKHKQRTMFGDVGSSHLILKQKRRTMFGNQCSTENREESPVISSRRDAHGVIKHVTATLLEVRPGLASSPTMTELSASAVEVLVFGDLYDDVFKEIIQQTEEKDESLVAKVKELQKKCDDGCTSLQGSDEVSSVSQSAIRALQSLPQAHSPTDKLLHCVEFLEYVSDHFSSSFQGKCIDADTLLLMVCQHVVAAYINHLHAEVAFIEEFSRDEQLLSGKEGYALITLQASLHYLDSLDVLPIDISPTNPESDRGSKQGMNT